MDPETWRQLQDADWQTITKALVVHGMSRSALLYPQRTAPGELGLGRTVEDIAHRAIEQAFVGERYYDPAKGALLPWLKDQMNSLMDHLFQGVPFRREVSADAEDEIGQTVVEKGSLQIHQAEQLAEEQQATNELKIDRVFEAADGDTELMEIIGAIYLDGIEPRPRYMATHLAISIPEVNKRLQRLRRRAAALNSRKPSEATHD